MPIWCILAVAMLKYKWSTYSWYSCMPQLHCYVTDELARKLREKARKSHLSISRYLALLVEQGVENAWPVGYFELFGKWEGEPLERPEQGDYEQRVDFD